MLAEGARSPADVILTVDIARPFVMQTRPFGTVNSDVLKSNIPANLRDPELDGLHFPSVPELLQCPSKPRTRM